MNNVGYQMTGEAGSKDRRGDKHLRIRKEKVRDYLKKLDIFKLVGPDRMHARVLKVLAVIISEPLAISSETLWRLHAVRKGNTVLILEKRI